MQLWDAVVSQGHKSPASQPELFIMNQLRVLTFSPDPKPSDRWGPVGCVSLNTECLSAQRCGTTATTTTLCKRGVVRWSGVPALGPTAWVQVQTLLLTSCDIWCQLVNPAASNGAKLSEQCLPFTCKEFLK